MYFDYKSYLLPMGRSTYTQHYTVWVALKEYSVILITSFYDTNQKI